MITQLAKKICLLSLIFVHEQIMYSWIQIYIYSEKWYYKLFYYQNLQNKNYNSIEL